MGSFLLTLITGVAAGAWAARAVARREVEALRAELRPPKPVPVPVVEEITPETLMVITAAVAAFLGKKAKIKKVTRATVSSSAWAQQGRVFVQASHNLQR